MSSPHPAPSDPARPDALLALLLSTDTFEAFLHELALLAVADLPPDSRCGITVTRDQRAATIASSDELTVAVDRIQYRTGQGPCLDTLATGQIHYIADTCAEQRWPAFCPEALAHGVRSCLALPMRGPGAIVGGFNLYSTHPEAFDADIQDRMRIFAGTAAGAVALGLHLADQSRTAADLRTTLASRSVIDQAIGIVMAQQRCPADQAFSLLSRASQNRNLKVRDLAAEIVTAVGGLPPDTGAFDLPD
ncbi:GAF and ANTAR domain-containing protein [Planobispora siamensis]|uniref:Transcription antitermination regulator n=1 Tax=Planobispora siamensis TaxID=936338 RepID=A0A8J3SUR2_9ACTN|nr:GAF and ANTAR domain-containing protein [Planobispora siamensis]GIH95968.1 transcription antitermination regulator [Planobispora siamensis]